MGIRSREISEDDAQGPVRATYEDIKSTMRMSTVNSFFRQLAVYPDYLQVAWKQLKPNIQTVFFERQADNIRAAAARAAEAVEDPPKPKDPTIIETLKVFHYSGAKMLLAVSALHSASSGQVPLMEKLPLADKRRVTSGVPAGMIRATEPNSVGQLEDVRMVRQPFPVQADDVETRDLLGGLERWPDFLQKAQAALSARPEQQQAAMRLRVMAGEALLRMPFRVEISPHVMRLVGLSEAEIETVHAIQHHYYQVLPVWVQNVALLMLGAVGRDEAVNSPFPITTV